MLLLDVGEEGGITEVALPAGTLKVPRFDRQTQLLRKGVLPLHKTIIY